MKANYSEFVRSTLIIIFVLLLSAPNLNATEAKVIRLDGQKMAEIRVTLGRTTIINFPIKPSKVILGSKGQFSIEYVENDIAIAALASNSSSNLFVYLPGRRFGFDLKATREQGDDIVLVRDLPQVDRLEGKP